MPRLAIRSELECREQIRTWLAKHRRAHRLHCAQQCEQDDSDLACKIIQLVRRPHQAENDEALVVQVRDAMYAASDAGQAGIPLGIYAATFTRFAEAAVVVLKQQQ